MSQVHIACDLCGGQDFKSLFPGNIPPEDINNLDRANTYFSSSRQSALHFRIVACNKCGLVMENPHDDEETLLKIYALLGDQVYEEEYTNRLYLAEQRVRQINQLTRPSQLLDVGCATGIFAGAAQRSGWSVTGIDPSQWAIDRARKENPGATFIQGAVAETAFPNDAFDVITLWDVLEHVWSPTQTLSALRPWLKTGGYILLNSPDISSWMARIQGRNWVLFLREHLWYFSPATLAQLLRKTGFSLMGVTSNSVRFTIGNILTRLQQYPGITRTASRRISAVRGIKSFSIRFPMGEMNALIQKI